MAASQVHAHIRDVAELVRAAERQHVRPGGAQPVEIVAVAPLPALSLVQFGDRLHQGHHPFAANRREQRLRGQVRVLDGVVQKAGSHHFRVPAAVHQMHGHLGQVDEIGRPVRAGRGLAVLQAPPPGAVGVFGNAQGLVDEGHFLVSPHGSFLWGESDGKGRQRRTPHYTPLWADVTTAAAHGAALCGPISSRSADSA